MLFPLPLAPWELLMLADDRPSHPMLFSIGTLHSGRICPQLFHEAIALVIARHPLLSARVEWIKGYPHWVEAPRAVPVLWAVDGNDSPSTNRREGIAIDREAGFRVTVSEGRSGIHITWSFHHACCDGVGACTVLADTMAIYHALHRGADWRSAVVALDARRLLDRANFRREAARAAVSNGQSRSFLDRMRGALSAVHEAVNTVSHWPVALKAGEPTGPSNDCLAGASLVVHGCDEAQSHRIQYDARSLGVGLNDLLMARIFQELAETCDRQSRRRSKSLMRITMPTTLRAHDDRHMPAANVMSYAFIDRLASDCRDLGELARGIHAATVAIQKHRLAQQLVDVLAIAARFPWLLPMVLNRRLCLSTAVFSNLGDPTRRTQTKMARDGRVAIAGDMRMESIYATPPIRPLTGLSIGVNQYRGLVTMAALVDRAAMSAAAARALLAALAGDNELSGVDGAQAVSDLQRDGAVGLGLGGRELE